MTLKEATELLRAAGVESPAYDAREIFCKLGGIPMSRLVLGGEVEDASPAAEGITARARRVPLEYILGEVDFYREKYKVGEGCLIPRDDTEILVDFAVGAVPRGELFVDLCTGSGCVGLSVLNNTENTRAIMVDISDSALAYTVKNAESLRLSERATVLKADALGAPVCERCFAVISNPPYVTEAEYTTLSEEIKKEPKIAFVGGTSGLDFYRGITEIYRDVIDKRGFIAFEIGFSQADALREIARDNSMSCEIIPDLSHRDRVAVLRPLE